MSNNQKIAKERVIRLLIPVRGKISIRGKRSPFFPWRSFILIIFAVMILVRFGYGKTIPAQTAHETSIIKWIADHVYSVYKEHISTVDSARCPYYPHAHIIAAYVLSGMGCSRDLSCHSIGYRDVITVLLKGDIL